MAYPPPPSVAFVTAQPKQYDIHSNFGMFTGERLLYHNEMKTGCCEFGDNYFTSVTDTRYVVRHEQCICCGCCCQRPSIDTTIYLYDVAQLHEVREGICCGDWQCERFCKCCNCLCCCCLCLFSKRLQLRGSFGSHILHIDNKDIPDFELMIAEAIAQHKLGNE